MSLLDVADAFTREANDVRRLTGALGRAGSAVTGIRRIGGPDVTVIVGGSQVDQQAAANYLSFFTIKLPITLPGYGIDPNSLTPGHGFDPASVEFYRSLFTFIRFLPPPATGAQL